jgi:hypothetical protein
MKPKPIIDTPENHNTFYKCLSCGMVGRAKCFNEIEREVRCICGGKVNDI